MSKVGFGKVHLLTVVFCVCVLHRYPLPSELGRALRPTLERFTMVSLLLRSDGEESLTVSSGSQVRVGWSEATAIYLPTSY